MFSIQFDDTVVTRGVQSSRFFHVQPSHSNLYPNDKPQTVAITFRPDKEVEYKHANIFKIQVRNSKSGFLVHVCVYVCMYICERVWEKGPYGAKIEIEI